MPTVYMLVGVPGSGKSTWLEDWGVFDDPDSAVISSDYHVERLADERGQTYDEAFKQVIKEAQNEMYVDLENAVNMEKNIYWDQTNTSVKSRKGKLEMIPDHYERVAIFFYTPNDEELNRRLDSREGKTIPPNVLMGMKSSITKPTRDEGFDEIIEVDPT